jgi:hypothetical protein
MGMAVRTGRTPAETRPTVMEVDVEEDWTMTVARMPTMSPAMGLLTPAKIV